MNEIQNTPNLRFEGFTEPWRQRKLMEEVTSIDTGKSKFLIHGTGKYEVLGSTSVIGFDDSYDYEGDFLLTARVGANAGELYRHSGKVKISDNTVFIQGEQLDFIYYSLLNFDIKKLSFGTGQPLIKASELKTLDIKVPEDTSEQKKIGELFFNLDSLIALQQRKYERLQHLKQALLRKMFPKPGEQVPELRFDGFTEPWEERKLGELYVRAGSGGTPSSGDPRYYGGHIPFLGIADMDGRFITKTEKSLTDDGLSNSAAWIVPAGSISLAMYASVGKVGITCCDMATSQAFYNMVFDSTVTRDFVYSRLDRADCLSEWRSLISTGTQSNLNAQKVRDWAVAMPSLPEQHAIGSLFRELDDFITLQQRKYERLQHLKQALLRKMFV